MSCELEGLGVAADGPFGHGEVDHPGPAHQQRPVELTRRAEDNFADRQGQRLRARTEAEGVAAHHPGAVPTDVSSPDRHKAEGNREGHERTEQQPQGVQESAIVAGS